MRLILEGEPERCLYPPGTPEPDLAMLCDPLLLDPGTIDAEAIWQGEGRAPSLTCRVQNQYGEATLIFAVPRRRARLEEDDGTLIFSGAIDGVTLYDQADIRIVA